MSIGQLRGSKERRQENDATNENLLVPFLTVSSRASSRAVNRRP
jgi:hypothetical protein